MASRLLGLLPLLLLNLNLAKAYPKQCYFADYRDKVPCGHPASNQAQCVARNCCWDDASNPRCYVSRSGNVKLPDCDYSLPADRIDCSFGSDEMDQPTCLSRNCCWNPVGDKKKHPSCFMKRNAQMRFNPADQCATPTFKRKECGYSGVTKDSCLRKERCCWDDTEYDGPHCYQGEFNVSPQEACDLGKNMEKLDCGCPNIDQRTCRKRGCCWDENSEPNCFIGKNGTMRMERCEFRKHSERIDCGHGEITQELCEERGCCWERSDKAPWCYFSRDGTMKLNRCTMRKPSQRSVCGTIFVTPWTCNNFWGCCWDQRVADANVCYKGAF